MELFLLTDEEERNELLQEEAAKHPFALNLITRFLKKPNFEVRSLGDDILVSL